MLETLITVLIKAPWRVIHSTLRYIRRKFLYRRKLGHFISPEQYYQRYLGKQANKATITHQFECVGRGDELDTILDDLDTGYYSVFHVSAPPGHGKSRFALELAKLLRGKSRGILWYFRRRARGNIWTVYFPRKDSSDVLEYVDELQKKSNVAIFFDDAHRSINQVRALANYAGLSKAEGAIRLFCFSRSTMSNLTLDSLAEIPPDEIREYPLRKLNKDEIGEMITTYLPNVAETTKEQILEFTQDSAFLTALVCQLGKRGVDFADIITEQQFRHVICDGPLKEAVQPCGVSSFSALRATAILSAATPSSFKDEHIREIVKDLAGITDAEFDCVIQHICRAALFEEFSNSLLRPTPDLIGALLLDSACIDDDGNLNDFSAELLNRLLPHYPKQALNNLTDVGWTKRSDKSLDVVRPYLDQLKTEAATCTPDIARVVLEILEPLSIRRSEDIVQYLELLVSRANDPEFEEKASQDEWRRVMGHAVPMLIASANDGQVLARSMELAFELIDSDGVSTPYSNHEPTYALSEILGFSPYKSVEHTLDALAIVEGWVALGGQRAIVSLNAIQGLLSPVIQWTVFDTFTVSYRTAAIIVSEKVKEVRSRSMDLVVRGLNHDELAVQRTAFEALDSVGRYHGGAGHDPNSELGRLVDQEKNEALNTLGCMIKTGIPMDVQILVEDQLWDWWRTGTEDFAARVEVVLSRIDDSPTYRLCKLLCSGDLPIVPIADLLDAEDDATRSDRFFSERRERRESSEQYMQQLFGELGLEDTSNAWAKFLTNLLNCGCAISWRANGIFYHLGRQHSEVGWSLAKSDRDEAWLRFRSNLLLGLRDANRGKWESELENLLSAGAVSSNIAIDWLTSISWRDPLGDLEWRFISILVDESEQRVQLLLADYLAHSGPDDWLRKREALLTLARQNLSVERAINNLFSGLVHDRPTDLKAKLNSVDIDSLKLLLAEGLDSYIPWDKPYWVGEFLALVATVDPERFFDFVEDSVAKFDGADEIQVRILGARNAEKAFDRLTVGDNRRSHLRKILGWAATENSLGILAGAFLAKGIILDDADLQQNLVVLYAAERFEDIARILQHFGITEGWLEEMRRLLIEADKSGPAVFSQVSELLSHSYYVGTTSRTPGYATPRDKMCADAFARYLDESDLSSRVRGYFADHKEIVEENIRRDIASDEALAGRRFDPPS